MDLTTATTILKVIMLLMFDSKFDITKKEYRFVMNFQMMRVYSKCDRAFESHKTLDHKYLVNFLVQNENYFVFCGYSKYLNSYFEY